MGAPKGNQFWMQRSSHGPKPIFASADELWSACCEYFEWVEDNPLYEAKAFAFQGEVTVERLPKMRAMTKAGMCLYIDLSVDAWDNYRKRPGFEDVTARAEQIIYEQKFAGAAADLLNANIIARDLHLRELTSAEVTGKNGGPIRTQYAADLSDEELAAELAALGFQSPEA